MSMDQRQAEYTWMGRWLLQNGEGQPWKQRGTNSVKANSKCHLIITENKKKRKAKTSWKEVAFMIDICSCNQQISTVWTLEAKQKMSFSIYKVR